MRAQHFNMTGSEAGGEAEKWGWGLVWQDEEPGFIFMMVGPPKGVRQGLAVHVCVRACVCV